MSVHVFFLIGNIFFSSREAKIYLGNFYFRREIKEGAGRSAIPQDQKKIGLLVDFREFFHKIKANGTTTAEVGYCLSAILLIDRKNALQIVCNAFRSAAITVEEGRVFTVKLEKTGFINILRR